MLEEPVTLIYRWASLDLCQPSAVCTQFTTTGRGRELVEDPVEGDRWQGSGVPLEELQFSTFVG